MTPGTVPDRPVIIVEISADQSVRVAGEVVPVPPGGDPRAAALAVVAEQARALGHPLRVHAMEADGTVFPLNVYADRSIAEAGAPIPPAQQRRGRFGRRRSAPEQAAAPVPAGPPVPQPPIMAPPPPAPAPTVAFEPAAPHPTWAPPGSSAAGARMPGGLPAPRHEQRLVLDLIHGAIRAGDDARALAMAADLDAGATTTADPAERLAMREVHGYVALVTGRPDLALRLYAEAVAFGGELTEPGEWPARMAANAHFCWLQITDRVTAGAMGAVLLDAYAAGGAADSPGARAARRWMEQAGARA